MKWLSVALGVLGAAYAGNSGMFEKPHVLIENVANQPQPMDMCMGDFDSDNDLDLAVANAAGVRFFENKNGKYVDHGLVFKAPYKNPDVDIGIDCGDLDMDSADEVVFVGPAGLVVLDYKDEALGSSPYSWEGNHYEKVWEVAEEIDLGLKHYKAGTDVQIKDVDGDGLEDIVVGTSEKVFVFPSKK